MINKFEVIIVKEWITNKNFSQYLKMIAKREQITLIKILIA